MNLIQQTLGQMNGENYKELSDLMIKMLEAAGRRKDGTQNKHSRGDDSE